MSRIVDYLGVVSHSFRALLRAIVSLPDAASLPRTRDMRVGYRETAHMDSVRALDSFRIASAPVAASPAHHLPADAELSADFRSLERRFTRLAAEWKADTEFESSTTRIAMHPAYQQIIGMGAPVLPLILKDLERTNDSWFWALHAITGVNPVASEDRGAVNRMVSAWLLWGMRTKIL